MSQIKKAIIFGAVIAFFIMGLLTMQRSMPSHKEERIYKMIQPYSPYTLEKYAGGLAIVFKETGEKEKPSAQEVYHRIEELERTWGKNKLRIKGHDLHILGDNNQTIVKIFIESEEEQTWLQQYFGI